MTRRLCMLAPMIALAGLPLSAKGQGQAPWMSTAMDLKISVVSDESESLPGLPVTVSHSYGEATSVVQEDQWTMPFQVPRDETMVVELREVATGFGRTIGQQLPITIGNLDSNGNPLGWELFALTQPSMRGYTLDRSKYTTAHTHALWEISGLLDESAGIFDAQIGMLPTKTTVDGYFAYHFGISPMDQPLAMMLREQGTDFGSEGIVVAISTKAQSFLGTPEVQLVHMATRTSHLGTCSLSASILSTTPEVTVLHLTGALGDGDNLILLNDGLGQVHPTAEYLSGRLNYTPGQPPSSGMAAAGYCDVCTPAAAAGVTPNCNWASHLEASSPSCPFNSYMKPAQDGKWFCSKVGEDCADGTGAPGSVLRGRYTWKFSSKVGGSLAIKIPEVGEWGYNWEEGEEWEESFEITRNGPALGAGEGCGQCQAWTVRTYREPRWMVRYQRVWWRQGCRRETTLKWCGWTSPHTSEVCDIQCPSTDD